MIAVHFKLPRTEWGDRFYCYRVAQQDLVANIALDVLAGYQQTCSDHVNGFKLREPRITADGAMQLYRGPGWIGNDWREVTCRSLRSGIQIDVAGIGEFWVSDDGEEIVCTNEDPEAGTDLVAEAALGPALILALARKTVYCLHASAVSIGGRSVVFAGESGKGKSTLARWLGASGEGTRRLADDVLPMSLGNGGLEALPHFPQLKHPVRKQPSSGFAERVPVTGLYILGRPVVGEAIEIRPLGSQEITLNLVRHTVASRLFDADILVDHLDFCAWVGHHIPVRELIYPLNRGALEVVQEALMDDLQTIPISGGAANRSLG